MAGAGTGGHGHPPAWTGYKRSVTIDGASYEELEYQFCSRRRKLTIHRRHALDDRGLRRRRFSRTLDDVRSGSVKNLKVPYPTRPLCRGSTLAAVERSRLLARWPGTHSRILSGIQRAAQTVLGVYLKRTCSRVTSASIALGVLNDYALDKSTHSLTPRAVGRSDRVRWSVRGGVWGALSSLPNRGWDLETCTSSLLDSLSSTFHALPSPTPTTTI